MKTNDYSSPTFVSFSLLWVIIRLGGLNSFLALAVKLHGRGDNGGGLRIRSSFLRFNCSKRFLDCGKFPVLEQVSRLGKGDDMQPFEGAENACFASTTWT